MEKIAISELNAKCLTVLKRVPKTRKPVCITRHGIPLVEVVPVSSVMERSAWLESMKGSVKILGDIVSPASEAIQIKTKRKITRRRRGR